ncbi:MAG TPA: alpha-L-arabinofuranosidase C-terminal domain-containing protein [Armatimonadota bacterium]|jgi:alpha-N-arabinofuranosidase
MSTEPTAAPAEWQIALDVSRRGAPISPYIYSQFIEHLGRCIQGGIWAEMLEDRKFYFAVGDDESPWKPAGAGGCVLMQSEDAFVGEHTPRVVLPGNGAPAGIAQGGLAVRAGKTYTGRIWLSGDDAVGSVQVSLVWGAGPDDRQTVTVSPIGPEYVKAPLRFAPAADSDDARLEITSAGSGSFRVGTASLMPSDNVEGMRADTLELILALDAPLYRWPGGNFVSGYDWRDGVGDRDRRPPRKNPAWRGVEQNDFGIHEFLVFCRLANTEPLIVVNTGFGDSFSAAQEVEYVNGGPETPMGRWRTANGRREPWDVTWWGVGNEMFGVWQLGYMALEQYVHKHNEVERRMRKVDPRIKTIGVGEAGPWSEGIMRHCADNMDLISEHFYCQEKPDIVEHVLQMPAAIKAKVDAHRKYRAEFESLKGKDIRIAMDEWNFWYGPEVFGELGTRYFMKDALGIAAGLHEYYRQSDIVYMAQYAQTVNVIGAIKTTRTAAAMETTGLVLELYRRHFGSIPLAVDGAPHPLDVSAAVSEDGRALTVAVVNPTDSSKSLALSLRGAELTGAGARFEIADADPMAYNDPSEPPRVVTRETPVTGFAGAIEAPAYGVVLYRLDLTA